MTRLKKKEKVSDRKFGFNPGIDATQVDIRSEDANLVYQTSAQALEIVSDNVADTSAGTGARTVKIIGLDANFLEIEEIITLNGTTPVDLVNTYIRINRAFVVTVGNGGENAGVLTIQLDGAGAVQATIPATEGQSQFASVTVPADKELIITQINYSMDTPTGVTFILLIRGRCRFFGKSWRTFYSAVGSGHDTLDLKNDELSFPPKTDIRFTGERLSGAADVRAEVGFNFKLQDK